MKAQDLMEIGDTIYHNWHEEGGGEMTRTKDGYELTECPQYGGMPYDPVFYTTLEEAKAEADTWT